MKLKAIAIFLIIILSLIPIYILYKYMERKMKPRESFGHFFIWMLTILTLIFVFTFCIVFVIQMLFPVP